METITYPIYLYWKKVTASGYQIGLSGKDEECCFYIPEAEITFSHRLDKATGEPIIEIDNFKNELGFVFDEITLAPGAAHIFNCIKALLEKDTAFLQDAFEQIEDNYVFTGLGPNDPNASWEYAQ